MTGNFLLKYSIILRTPTAAQANLRSQFHASMLRRFATKAIAALDKIQMPQPPPPSKPPASNLDSSKALVARCTWRLIAGALVSSLCACASTPSDGILKKSLELVGLQTLDTAELASKKAELAKLAAASRIPLRIHASEQLNSDGASRPLSLVVKIFKLKGHEAFTRLPYAAFAESAHQSDEVLSSREVVLLPGQRYEVEERLPAGTTHLGVVALFRSAEVNRWRFVFDLNNTGKEGITLGAHQCALSVAHGATVGSAPEIRRLAGAVCRQ